MKRAVLTGATGFVGANLARRLLRDGHSVHLLVRASHSGWRIKEIQSEVEVRTVDFTDASALNGAIKEIRPDWIFHLAAHGAYSWQTDVAQIVQTNIIATINLVNACLEAGFEAFIHTGSSSEYGYKDHAPGEKEWIDPNSYYAVGKASATLFCRYTAQSRGKNITTLRLYSAYGAYEDPNRLMPALIRHGLKGELPPLVNPDIARDYIHVDDVCEACILAAKATPREFGGVYNIGTGVQTSLREAVETARRVLKISIEPKWGSMPARNWDTSVWVADPASAIRELGWKPQYRFEEGFAQMADWYSAHPDALTPVLGGV